MIISTIRGHFGSSAAVSAQDRRELSAAPGPPDALGGADMAEAMEESGPPDNSEHVEEFHEAESPMSPELTILKNLEMNMVTIPMMQQMMGGVLQQANQHSDHQLGQFRVEVQQEFKELRWKIEEMASKGVSDVAGSRSFSSVSSTGGKRRLVDSEGSMSMSSSDKSYEGDPMKAKNNRIWIAGFPRELTVLQMRNFAEQALKPLLGDELWKQLVLRTFGIKKTFSIDFKNHETAQWFLERTRECSIQYEHPGDSTRHSIRFRPDRTVDDRRIIAFLTELWKATREALSSHNTWKESAKLSTTGSGGVLYIADGEEIWKFFSVKKNRGPLSKATLGPGGIAGSHKSNALSSTASSAMGSGASQPPFDDEQWIIQPHPEMLLDWGITEAEADTIIQRARRGVLLP